MGQQLLEIGAKLFQIWAIITNRCRTTLLSSKLGFVIHPEKSTFNPCLEIEYLGFVINSIKIAVSHQLKNRKYCHLVSSYVLGRCTTKSLLISKGSFDKIMHVSKEAIQNVLWWKHKIIGVYAPIARKNPSVVINTDASSFGSRVSLGLNKKGGQFSTEESQQQINILELKATRFGLKSLCKNEFDSHILIQIDNTSAVSATNKMGV